MNDQPATIRELALDAAKAAINAGGYWLPVDGQTAVVDAIAGVYEAGLAARLDRVLADAAHHAASAAQSAEKHPDIPELAAAHSGMAAGLHIAAAHLACGKPELLAQLKQQIDQPDPTA